MYNLSCYGIKKIGALLSNTPVSNVGPGAFGLVLQYPPQIESNTFLNDTINWLKVSGTYTALGGEEYITIGNFSIDSSTDTINIQNNLCSGSYYFIEDVRVEKIPNCDSTLLNIEANKKNYNLKLYPNPNNGSFTVEYSIEENDQADLCIYSIEGRKIACHKLNSTEKKIKIQENLFSNGMYFYQIHLNGNVAAQDRLIIIK